MLSEALNHAAVTKDPAILREAKDQAVYALLATGFEACSIIANNTQLAWEQSREPRTGNGWKKTPWLRPLAWVYQLGRYVRLGLKSSRIKDVKKNMSASRKRNRLMDELGATRMAFKD